MLTAHQRAVLVAITLNDVPIDVLAERRNTTRGALPGAMGQPGPDKEGKTMLDSSLTEEQRSIRDLAHDFAEQEIRPVAWEYDRDGGCVGGTRQGGQVRFGLSRRSSGAGRSAA